jgi:hypothetical protein
MTPLQLVVTAFYESQRLYVILPVCCEGLQASDKMENAPCPHKNKKTTRIYHPYVATIDLRGIEAP